MTRRDVAETYLVIAPTAKPYFAKNTATETTLTEGEVSAVLRTERTFDPMAMSPTRRIMAARTPMAPATN